MDVWNLIIDHFGVLLILCLIILLVYYFEYRRSTGRKVPTFKFTAFLLIFLIILPVIAFIILFFLLFSQILKLILKIKYGSRFKGLLPGKDAIHHIDGESKNVGNILFIIHYQGNNFCKEIKNLIIKKLSEDKLKIPKLWYGLHSYIGYSYYLENSVNPEKYIKEFENFDAEEISKTNITEIISKYCNINLPKNHTGLWEVIISSQPINWKDNSDNYYPVLLRIHHSFTDASSFIKTFTRTFGNGKLDSFKGGYVEVNENLMFEMPIPQYRKLTSIKDFFKSIVKCLYAFSMIPPILLAQGINKAKDKNILHGSTLSDQKILTYEIEELPYYSKVIRKTKDKIPNTTFSDILFAAMSASFGEYFHAVSNST